MNSIFGVYNECVSVMCVTGQYRWDRCSSEQNYLMSIEEIDQMHQLVKHIHDYYIPLIYPESPLIRSLILMMLVLLY